MTLGTMGIDIVFIERGLWVGEGDISRDCSECIEPGGTSQRLEMRIEIDEQPGRTREADDPGEIATRK